MFFKVLQKAADFPTGSKNRAYLRIDNWDDWGKFATMYALFYFDVEGESHRIGEVKVGQFGLTSEQRRPPIPQSFNALDESFFSLGQDPSYYEKLNELGDEIRRKVLSGLRDVALDSELFERALDEDVMGVSLLRSVSRSVVRGQFRRIAAGGVRLTSYSFSYEAPQLSRTKLQAPKFTFNVKPESNPPTNIHVLIGRNGVGKTHHLQLMTRALVEPNSVEDEVGVFRNHDDVIGRLGDDSEPVFENIVSITFSAFDPFEPLPVRQNKSEGVRYQYIGLKKSASATDRAPKTPTHLGREFASSFGMVTGQEPTLDRWRKALEVIESDPIFRDANISSLAGEIDGDEEGEKSLAAKMFSKLSSGHKIVLLTITRLVETVDERTLVLLDEPEAHLHPPLLSAFIRALSDLLSNRNGVAIIATHSPVVLQEVPKQCVWKIRRSGREVTIERPEIETFGENVGVLTREVFGLEVTETGFHQLLNRSVAGTPDYAQVLESFNQQLGAEARAIVQGMIAGREVDGSK